MRRGYTKRSDDRLSPSRPTIPPWASIYKKPVLLLYDLVVLWFSNHYAWNCPTKTILGHYNRNVSGQHLDVGVGTGYYLSKCVFPTSHPRITLIDLNENSLDFSRLRLQRYAPTTLVVDVMQPLPKIGPFESIAATYLLHCLPGPPVRKQAAIAHLAEHLHPRGVLFGATILGTEITHGVLARALLHVYNRWRIFGNVDDSASALRSMLEASFGRVDIDLVGSVALFAAWEPKEQPGLILHG